MRPILIILLFTFSLWCKGQTTKKENYTIYLNYPDYTIKTDVVSAPIKLKIKEDLVYYWYSSNKIHDTKGGFDGKILNGAYTSFYLSGALREKGQFKKGLKNGQWILWYEDGKMQSLKNWKDGLQTGVYKVFDIKGNQILEEHYKNGVLNGSQIFIENGKIVSSKRFKNGKEILPKEKKIKPHDGNETKKKIFAFRKRNKAEDDNKVITEKKNSNRPTLKNKLKSIFQKKQKRPETEVKSESK